ncbi:hypothetical protein [Pedobacter jeongneungensis]|uniref:hypothetical protein n=1 Tax=Pedobacter jeongneungensis TaxID=947309 RepID=UPI0004693F3A|nr:hypothetical protein [Pedobacter jeongneungensis]
MKTQEIYIVLQATLSLAHANIHQSINEILTDGRCILPNTKNVDFLEGRLFDVSEDKPKF